MMGASRGAVAAAQPSELSAPVATPAASPELPGTAAEVGIVNDGEIDPFDNEEDLDVFPVSIYQMYVVLGNRRHWVNRRH